MWHNSIYIQAVYRISGWDAVSLKGFLACLVTIQKSAIWCFHPMSSNLRVSPVKTTETQRHVWLANLASAWCQFFADTETSRVSRNTKDSGQSQLVTLLKAHVQNDFKTCRTRVFADKNGAQNLQTINDHSAISIHSKAGQITPK